VKVALFAALMIAAPFVILWWARPMLVGESPYGLFLWIFIFCPAVTLFLFVAVWAAPFAFMRTKLDPTEKSGPLSASNTGPNLTLRFEAKTEEGLQAIDDEVTGILNEYLDAPK